jgi:hypothetical protein
LHFYQACDNNKESYVPIIPGEASMPSKKDLTVESIEKRLKQLEIDIVLKQLELVELQKRKSELTLLKLHKEKDIEE